MTNGRPQTRSGTEPEPRDFSYGLVLMLVVVIAMVAFLAILMP